MMQLALTPVFVRWIRLRWSKMKKSELSTLGTRLWKDVGASTGRPSIQLRVLLFLIKPYITLLLPYVCRDSADASDGSGVRWVRDYRWNSYSVKQSDEPLCLLPPGRANHWSAIIGASHSKNYVLWEYGGYASDGVKQVAELGSPVKMEEEIRQKVRICSNITVSRLGRLKVGLKRSVFLLLLQLCSNLHFI